MSRVMVLVGGHSNEREISLNSGAAIATALIELEHEVKVLDTGRPDLGALPLPDFLDAGAGKVMASAKANRLLIECLTGDWRPELVFIALHGGLGEDGTVQGVLDWLDIPYTGCGMAASALAMDKMTSKRIFRDAGIEVPEGILWRLPEGGLKESKHVLELEKAIDGAIGYPAVVKPNSEGSSVGVAILEDKKQTLQILPRIFQVSGELLIECYIEGREITATVLGDSVFPLVEIKPESGLYDYEHKYEKGKTVYQCPAELPANVSKRIKEEALLASQLLGCRHMVRVDFRLDYDDEPVCLELNTIPGMTETSLCPMAAAAEGLDFKDLVAEIADLALDS
ncbi:MAG: D-alanine--D-alanine ligase [bacterium]|nr:D-alanine--D-alanine ligase [bacterium]